ncbi:hypothetical protein KUH03_30380 [Sphingobacterium sp. E70]|uniref:DUF6597 domain-containing transcriptional factor n=1 Tax=Sphingobacterium sp. E70 TaxID=2853439 RepID=UPI00211CBDCE|nr:DUF6597 domain-containing transcriptional factor [Sphingobacterium sp. E70]ULT23461.1 hypothetical protein KUH03_30380 [Sphingobacterium sp. E70]
MAYSETIEMIEEIAYRPKYPLSGFIDYIWVGKSPNLTMDFVHHAALFTELIFSYGDDYDIRGINTEKINGRTGVQVLSGLKNRPFLTTTHGAYACIGLILKPFCYGILLPKLGAHLWKKWLRFYLTVFLLPRILILPKPKNVC